MLTWYDEFLCHQLSTTFDHVLTSDARWTERVVIYGFDTSGKANIMTGLARYPNRNVIDAYGMVTINSKIAHVVRTSKELRPETSSGFQVGPYRYEVVQPLKRVRASLGENDYGLRFQIDFEGAFPPYEQLPAFFRSRGRVQEDARRYYQLGSLAGWIEVDGKTYQLDKLKWHAGRDHSWGVRRGVGGGNWPEPMAQPEEIPPGVLYFMCLFDFGRYMIHCAVREDWEGKPWHFEGWIIYPYGSDKEGQALKLLSVEHDFSFRSDVRMIKSGRVTVHAIDGSQREISIRPVTYFLPGPAGYDYYNDYTSGMWKGPSFIDGFKLDVSDPDVLRRFSFLTETLCQVRCGEDIGYGDLEMVFVGKYPRYGYQGY